MQNLQFVVDLHQRLPPDAYWQKNQQNDILYVKVIGNADPLDTTLPYPSKENNCLQTDKCQLNLSFKRRDTRRNNKVRGSLIYAIVFLSAAKGHVLKFFIRNNEICYASEYINGVMNLVSHLAVR